MERLQYLSPEEAEEIGKKFGYTRYNDAPANWEEVDAEWLATKSTFRIYGFTHTWYQQITNLPNEKHTLSVHCFGSWDGTGFAMHTDYWGKKIRYFKFAGCIHEWRQPTPEEWKEHKLYSGRCLHHSICDKCGLVHTVDSSD